MSDVEKLHQLPAGRAAAVGSVLQLDGLLKADVGSALPDRSVKDGTPMSSDHQKSSSGIQHH